MAGLFTAAFLQSAYGSLIGEKSRLDSLTRWGCTGTIRYSWHDTCQFCQRLPMSRMRAVSARADVRAAYDSVTPRVEARAEIVAL